ncbi:MAG: FKBP-type peptidyl-prolyl cis-trans isomerase [Muribaculaceae bacterium]|nr:FKBP-type peptidyl-prolyl cis-trans isomerase [Muribaculaceae bacterium]
MKKILFAVATAGFLMAASSCNDKFKTTDAESALADSVAITSAKMFGTNMKAQLIPQLEYQLGDRFNKSSFEKGLKAGCMLDTADISYVYGLQYGSQFALWANQMAKDGYKVNQGKVAKTVVEALNDSTIDMQELMMEMNRLQDRLKELKEVKEAKEREVKTAENVKAGEDYVADLKKKDADVKTTESGLTYKIEAAGDDTRATESDLVSVAYVGKHLDGTVFDSSEGKPVQFSITQVVPGFSEGLQLIGKGGKATLYIPGELAYGANGQPYAGIGPNEMLVFEIEVTDIQPISE